MSDLVHAAEELPAESKQRAPVTLLGAAHYWAKKYQDERLAHALQARKLVRWRLLAWWWFLAFVVTWAVRLWIQG